MIVGELHDILGSVGEPRFGDPKPLLDDPAIQAWSASKRGQAVYVHCADMLHSNASQTIRGRGQKGIGRHQVDRKDFISAVFEKW